MKIPLLLALSALLLASCNVVVTTPAQPELSVAPANLPGRWHNVEEDGGLSADEYLELIPVSGQNRYNVVVYENGREEAIYQVSLCPAGKRGGYWGFTRAEEFSAGFLLFHLEFTDEGAEFHWPDAEKTESLLASAGLPFEFDRETSLNRFSTLKIHATWTALLEVLNAEGVDVLDSSMTLFRRGPSDGGSGLNPGS